MMVRYFELGKVVERESRLFGIVAVFKTKDGEKDQILGSLGNLFLAADFKNYQTTQPNNERFEELGEELLCIEDHHAHDAILNSIIFLL